MRVAFYLGRSIPESGGGFTFEQSILEALRKTQTKHEFYFFYQKDLKREFATARTFGTKALRKLKNFIKFDKNNKTSDLNRAVEKYKIELVWFLTPEYQFVDAPFVYTIWDLQHRLQSYFPEVSVTGCTFESRENYYKNIIPRATYVITGNEAGKEEIKLFYGIPDFRIKTVEFPTPDFVLNNNVVVHPPIDTLALRALGVSGIKRNYLFYPAQFWPHKNHVLILLAMKILREKYNIELDVVFTGSDKGNLCYIKEKAKELGLERNTYFLGFVPSRKLISLYENAFALIFPSFFGPNNIPPLEAFALSCPVIAANVLGAQYQLKDATLFFNPTNENELADKIKILFEDKNLRTRLIKNGLNIAKSWTSKDYVNSIIKIIDEFEPIRRCWSSKEKYFHP